MVSVGDEVGKVAPGTLSVTGTLTPDQQYRLVGAPTQASVTLTGGPAPFDCTGLRVGAAPTTGHRAASPTAPARARRAPSPAPSPRGHGVPRPRRDVEITNGTAADAVVVPITAVQGTVQTGNVWVVAADGTQREARGRASGLTDGKNVQVTEGLAAGDTILEFIPVPGGTGKPVDCSVDYDPTVVRRMSLLELTDVTRSVRLPDDRLLHILQGVTVAVDAGEHVAIVGRSGTGKSTLLNILGLLDAPTSGQYLLEGVPIGQLSNGARTRRRGRRLRLRVPAVQPAARPHGAGERRPLPCSTRAAGSSGPAPGWPRRCSSGSAWATGWTPCPTSSRAASSSASRSPGRWCADRA